MAVDFESVIADGVIYPAFTDDDGVLWIDDEDDYEVVVDHAVVDGVIYEAEVDGDGRLHFPPGLYGAGETWTGAATLSVISTCRSRQTKMALRRKARVRFIPAVAAAAPSPAG